MYRYVMSLFVLVIAVGSLQAQTTGGAITIVPVVSGLQNPRGVAITPAGDLLVVEAGTGSDAPGDITGSGRILQLVDTNGDGDYDDADDERIVRLDDQPSFNSLKVYRTGHDEPFGLSDIIYMPDDRVFFTKDHPFAEAGRNTGGEGYYGDVGIFILNTQREGATRFVKRSATLNAFAYDADRDRFFVTESGYNRIMWVDMQENTDIAVDLPALAQGQQAVPSGISVDPLTGDVLVALFSGFVYDYLDTRIGFMPGASKIMRYDPDTGELSDAVTGLTTAIDVAVDEAGNLFVVQLTTRWPPNPMPFEYDLTDPTLPPDPGGYARYSGRVTLHPADGAEPVIIADGLDTPTNITYHDGALYVSSGLGTPGRSILTPQGIGSIEGIVYRITGF